MLPEDDGALWCIIYRCENDWENSFVLQYDELLWWMVRARNALTQSEDLHSLSLEDLEFQIGYILFILGQHASPDSRFRHTCYQRAYPPYRPFGVRASIALICHAFMGIQSTEMKGYESKEIWIHDQEFFSTMASRLQKSPLFAAEVPMHQLQSMILSLQKAFQLEEIRVASTKPQAICIGNGSGMMAYYRRAFLSLNPMLLSKILMTALEIEPMAEASIDYLATFLAGIFHQSYPMEDLEAAFKKVPEILQSKSDRVVVTEMFHVKAHEQACQLGHLGESSPARGRRETDDNDQRRWHISYVGVPCFSGAWRVKPCCVTIFNGASWSCRQSRIRRDWTFIVWVSVANENVRNPDKNSVKTNS